MRQHDYDKDLEKTKFYNSDKYEYITKIGQGGYGACYLIATKEKKLEDVKLYALKIGSMKVSIDNEIEIFKNIHVPLAVSVIEHYSEDEEDVYWYLMEYIPGISLSNLIEQIEDYPLKEEIFLKIVVLLCRQISALHSKGVEHRDIKPDNIIIDSDFVPHIIDYGDCKCGQDYDDYNSTESIHGTFPFMSKEAMNKKNCCNGDIFSLGATIYNMITRCFPFEKLYRYIETNDNDILKYYKNKADKSSETNDLFQDLKEIQYKFKNISDESDNLNEKLENMDIETAERDKQLTKVDKKIWEIEKENFDIVNNIVYNIITNDEYDDIYKNIKSYSEELSSIEKEQMEIVYLCFNPEPENRPSADDVEELFLQKAQDELKKELKDLCIKYGFKQEKIEKHEINNLEFANKAIEMKFDYREEALREIGKRYFPNYCSSEDFSSTQDLITDNGSFYQV